jgi:predicted alpha/beta-fold hydrolase
LNPARDGLPYRAPAWLRGGHAQTIYPQLIKSKPPAYRRERWESPDGDFIDLDWVDGPVGTPLVVLFHGLEGSSSSHYAGALMRHVAQRGWTGVVPHFRGCSGEPNRLPRAYHSGDHMEIDWILRRVAAARPQRPRYAAGVSLGGSALLNWLGRQAGEALVVIDAAAAVCAPLDLHAAGSALSRGFNKLVYAQHFLLTLKPNALAKLRRHPGLVPPERIRAARTLREFDDAVTAPLHGYRSVDDYWTRASSKPWLKRIRVPTLIINARNDPFVPARSLPTESEVSRHVTLEYPEQGGHVGFVSGSFPGRLDWLPERLLRFFSARAAHPASLPRSGSMR